MNFISKKDCFFYRLDKKSDAHCLLHQRLCGFCSNKVPVIEGLETKDYVSLSFSKSSFRASFSAALFAISISLGALLISLFTRQPIN